MSNEYINNANAQMREASQWLKDFKANPDKYGKSSSTSSPAPANGGLDQMQALLSQGMGNTTQTMMSYMMMLMMMQMMQQVGGMGMPGNAASGGLPFPGFPGLPSNVSPAPSTPTNALPPVPQEALTRFNDILSQTEPTPEDTQKMMMDWESAGFSDVQFGKAAMYLLHQGSDETASKLSQKMPAWIDQGALNPMPFLGDDYLKMLPTGRMNQLSSAVSSAGLTFSDGAPNQALMGYLMSNTASTDETAALGRQMSTDVLHKLWQAREENPVALDLLRLAGYTISDDDNEITAGPIELKAQWAA